MRSKDFKVDISSWTPRRKHYSTLWYDLVSDCRVNAHVSIVARRSAKEGPTRCDRTDRLLRVAIGRRRCDFFRAQQQRRNIQTEGYSDQSLSRLDISLRISAADAKERQKWIGKLRTYAGSNAANAVSITSASIYSPRQLLSSSSSILRRCRSPNHIRAITRHQAPLRKIRTIVVVRRSTLLDRLQNRLMRCCSLDQIIIDKRCTILKR